MKYVFFGTPRFAAIVLEGLLNAGMPPAALVANPDRPVGRKKIVTPPATKELVHARAPEITILQPEQLDENFIKELKALSPDLFVVAAYAKIIPKTILAIPRLGTLGVHPSLLPKYRGSSPIQSAILNGEKETGTSIYSMDEKMDHGSVFLSRAIPIEKNESYPRLEERLARLSGEVLVEVMPQVIKGTLSPMVQNESQATYTKKFATDDAFVDEKDLKAAQNGDAGKAEMIQRKINAFDPQPGAWTILEGKRVKLLHAEIENGSLKLKKIQNEGETPKDHRSS